MLNDMEAARQRAGRDDDKRLLRGSKSRRRVLDRAIDVASVSGLDGVTFGKLAADLGVSKAGIQTLFASKEALQLATIERATALFSETVIDPCHTAPAGIARLRALLERWVIYAEMPLFEGGCFWGANVAAFDSQPGPIHDALFARQQEWIGVLAEQLRCAIAEGELTARDIEATAFELDAVLMATNIALRAGDANAIKRARRITGRLLGST
jgi:AcrR family transcriptional regulator